MLVDPSAGLAGLAEHLKIVQADLGKVGGMNVDDLVGGVNALTPYALYVLGNSAKEWFKNRILLLDAQNVVARKKVEVKLDDSVVQAAKNLYEQVFAEQLAEEAAVREALHVEHPEWFRDQVCLPSSSGLRDMLWARWDAKLASSVAATDLASAVQGYKSANELLKNVPNDLLTPYCTEIRSMLNAESKDAWNETMRSTRAKLNLPEFSEWLATLPLTPSTVTSYRLVTDRSPCSDWTPMQALLSEMLQLLLSR